MSKQKSLAVRAKCLTKSSLKKINPITDNQIRTFEAFNEDKHLMMHGCAGTGKTFIMLYLAMRAVLSRQVDQQKVYIVRSMLPTRDIGFLTWFTRRENKCIY